MSAHRNRKSYQTVNSDFFLPLSNYLLSFLINAYTIVMIILMAIWIFLISITNNSSIEQENVKSQLTEAEVLVKYLVSCEWACTLWYLASSPSQNIAEFPIKLTSGIIDYGLTQRLREFVTKTSASCDGIFVQENWYWVPVAGCGAAPPRGQLQPKPSRS